MVAEINGAAEQSAQEKSTFKWLEENAVKTSPKTEAKDTSKLESKTDTSIWKRSESAKGSDFLDASQAASFRLIGEVLKNDFKNFDSNNNQKIEKSELLEALDKGKLKPEQEKVLRLAANNFDGLSRIYGNLSPDSKVALPMVTVEGKEKGISSDDLETILHLSGDKNAVNPFGRDRLTYIAKNSARDIGLFSAYGALRGGGYGAAIMALGTAIVSPALWFGAHLFKVGTEQNYYKQVASRLRDLDTSSLRKA